ncbi:amino acid ABC transporter permease [Pandoraea soli]|uniref:ABC transporter permease n=1 Tax=Pandoraea soli TaxID=2508293 RepID=A0ABY6W837_9BURK|nr:amino acid ABC transporter permease [Pandoraea soli]VVE38238.1 ABC transporter permease [Pandoraea soli]
MQFNLSFLLTNGFADMLLSGARTTLSLFACAWVGSFIVALVIVVLRVVPARPVTALMSAFVVYHRNVPTVVQIMVWYFGMPQMLPRAIQIWINHHDSEFLLAAIALSLNAAAYFSEDIRSGLRSVPYGQIEAARSIGLSAGGSMRYVLLPQALRIGLPSLLNRSLILFKDTSLSMVIGVAEMTYQVHAIENQTFRAFEVFAVSTVFYLVSCWLLMGLGAWLSRRYAPAPRG